jgi:hypothetical protein
MFYYRLGQVKPGTTQAITTLSAVGFQLTLQTADSSQLRAESYDTTELHSA